MGPKLYHVQVAAAHFKGFDMAPYDRVVAYLEVHRVARRTTRRGLPLTHTRPACTRAEDEADGVLEAVRVPARGHRRWVGQAHVMVAPPRPWRQRCVSVAVTLSRASSASPLRWPRWRRPGWWQRRWRGSSAEVSCGRGQSGGRGAGGRCAHDGQPVGDDDDVVRELLRERPHPQNVPLRERDHAAWGSAGE